MVQKINGAAYTGMWVERNTAFVKVTFSKDISKLLAADLVLLGTTTPVTAGTEANSAFGVVESALVQALKYVEGRATILGISEYNPDDFCVDIFLGHAEGWFSDIDGVIAPPVAVPPAVQTTLDVVGARALVTGPPLPAPPAPPPVTNAPIGAIVTVKDFVDPAAVPPVPLITFKLEFAAWDGTMQIATGKALVPPAVSPVPTLALGPGATSGATPPGSPTGTPGYYPKTYHAS